VSALVVNRLFPSFAPDPAPVARPAPEAEPRPVAPAAESASTDSAAGSTGSAGGEQGAVVPVAVDPLAYDELKRNLEEFLVVARREERYVGELAEEVAPAPVVRVPFLKEDVHDLGGLALVARHLLNGQLVSGRGSRDDRK
jgi:hypothetical protein